jgi:hypothetical protein
LETLDKNKIPFVFIPGPLRELNWDQYNIVWPTDILDPWQLGSFRIDGNHLDMHHNQQLLDCMLKITCDWK